MSHPPNSLVGPDPQPSPVELSCESDCALCALITFNPHSEAAGRAFNELYKRHFVGVYAYILRFAKLDKEVAWDVSQDTWEKVSKALANGKKPELFRAWAMSIGKNTFFDRMKGMRRRKQNESQPEERRHVSQHTFDAAEGADQAILESSVLFDEEINAERITNPVLHDALYHLEDHERYAFIAFAHGEKRGRIASGALGRFGEKWDLGYVNRLLSEAKRKLAAALINHRNTSK